MLRTGHMLRLPETTPVRLALKDTNINRKKHRGTGNKMTWKKLINRDLSNVDKSLSLESFQSIHFSLFTYHDKPEVVMK